ncbi:MAG: DUF1697 domain-containing protein [Cephaloticoccus sp.]|nr:DUF1697 domain-containing protein [Cephaloticoccus sp.]
MPRYVAFLRSINVGRRRVVMAELKRHFEALGFTAVSTFIASGNVIFTAPIKVAARLERQIETGLAQALGFPVETFVRTVDEVAAIAGSRPFRGETPAGGAVYVTLLKAPLPVATARALTAIRTATDEFCVRGREYYWLCRIRSSDSKIWASPEIKALKLAVGTARNMTSVRKLATTLGIA